jgi:hypothetical protein
MIAHILAILLDRVEGIEDRVMRGLPSAQFLKTGQAVGFDHDGLAVDREALCPDPLRRGRDRRQSRGPVVSSRALEPSRRTIVR